MLGGRQGGRVSHRQLVAAGIPSSTVHRWVEARRLQPLGGGVHAVGHAAETRLTRMWEGLLTGGAGALAFERSAGWLLDFVPAPSLVHVAVRDRSPHERPGVRFHRPSTVRDEDVIEVDGVPTTSAARTLVDLAAVLPYDRLRRVLKQAELLHLLDVVAIAGVLDHVARPRGVRNLRRALENVPPLTRSRLELRVLDGCANAGLPVPEMNARLEVAAGAWVEVDALWRSWGVVLEVDGRAVHAGVLAQEDDASKQRRLEQAGLVVLRASEEAVVWRLKQVTDAVAEALRASRDGSFPTG